MIEIEPFKQQADEHRTNYLFMKHNIFLHHLFLAEGKTHCVYRVSDYPDLINGNPEGMNALRSVTVIPPPGHVLIHSDALSRPGDWRGNYHNVGGGVVFSADFYYEALVDSDWLCVSWMPERRAYPKARLDRKVLEAGESFTFTKNTELVISMLGTKARKGFTARAGEEFIADETTLLAIIERI